MSDATNLFKYWLNGIRGVIGGVKMLLRDGFTPGPSNEEVLRDYIKELQSLLADMVERNKGR